MESRGIVSFYAADAVRLRFKGTVDMDSVLALCDEIDLAISYYQYPQVVVELESPGGDLRALDHYTSRLTGWRQKYDLRVATLGLGNVASAAAVMLSLGDVGSRQSTDRRTYCTIIRVRYFLERRT